MSGSANLALLLDGPARARGDAPAVLLGDRPVRSWTGLADAVARRAGALATGFGIRPGDPVAIVAANCPEYLEWLLAIWHAGAVAVPVSGRLHAREAAALLADCSAPLCVTTEDLAGGLAPLLTSRTRLLVVGDDDERATVSPDPIEPVRRSALDDAWIFYTSGTTGKAKGARLSHGNLLAMSAAYYADVADVGARDTFVHVAALSHASGLFALPFLARGAAQVLPVSAGFDAAELLDLVGRHDRSSFFVPPVLLRRLTAAVDRTPEPPAVDRLGTVLVGAAPVLDDDLRRGVAALGPRLWNGYGQGESPCTITAMPAATMAAALDEPDRLASVGTARWATRVRVVDIDGRPLPAGEVGEVVVDGPTVMTGYLGRPDATAETLRGGWLHTGDLGRFDDAGHLTLVDRAKDVVITGGYNVYPREVEDVLVADPAVAEAAVVGVPDAEWGVRLVAFVVPTQVQQPDTRALDARCLASIARHKRPTQYVVVEALPRNAAGKVLKTALRGQVPAAEGQDADGH
jgi:long-chain acyl-CoA synthetase